MCLNLHPDMGLTSTGLEISSTVRLILQVLYFKQSTGLNLHFFVHTEKNTDIHKYDPWIILTIKLESRRMNSLIWLIWFGFLGDPFFRQTFLPLELGMGHFFKQQALVHVRA